MIYGDSLQSELRSGLLNDSRSGPLSELWRGGSADGSASTGPTVGAALPNGIVGLGFALVAMVTACAAPDQGVARLALGCVEPASDMAITEDTVLCAGDYALKDPEGDGAIRVLASGITLRCDGTELRGGEYFGDDDENELGVAVIGQSNVNVIGCRLRGYRYGVFAKDAVAINVFGNDLRENFSDEGARWIYDGVRGGGVRFDRVETGLVADNDLSGNWNGIELRGSRAVVMQNNVADFCSNTGALLLDSHGNHLLDNRMRWAVRGFERSLHGGPETGYAPTAWHEQRHALHATSTMDSAAILLDMGSSDNVVRGNDLIAGGDGVYLRAALVGGFDDGATDPTSAHRTRTDWTGAPACPSGNVIEDNDLSFSAHNGIESWCPSNTMRDNVVVGARYGMWLGGTDGAVVEGNRIEDSYVDGISVQNAHARGLRVTANDVRTSGRYGLLISGRVYQAWQDPAVDAGGTTLFNVHSVAIEHNRFADNGMADRYQARGDVYVSWAQNVLLTHNCYSRDGAAERRVDTPSAEHVWSSLDEAGVDGCDLDLRSGLPSAHLVADPAVAAAYRNVDVRDGIDGAPLQGWHHQVVQIPWRRLDGAEALPPSLQVGATSGPLSFGPPDGVDAWELGVVAQVDGRALAFWSVIDD